ncbi:hypothetical protein [Kribbella deserti]|uniref:Uncharacterized protein n=1 Tax=Kribbella deserti TaxID=1926257 RepID=A0ABV6QU02_9ACTN
MTEQYDDVTRAFAQVDTLDVPTTLDPKVVAAGGRRRLRVRRTSVAVGGAALATGLVAVLAGVTGGGPAQGEAPFAGGPSTAGRTVTMDVHTGKAIPPHPADELVDRLAEELVRFGQKPRLLWPDPFNGGRVGIPVTNGTRAGYVGLVAELDPGKVAAANRQNGCAIAPYPYQGKAATCRKVGDHWEKVWTDSNQGRTVLIRFLTDKADVMLIQSQGYPSHREWAKDSPDLLPWHGDPLSPDYNGTTPRKIRPLAALPLTSDQQVTVARKLATLAR